VSDTLGRKIVDPQALSACLAPLRAAGRRVVHCHGCFDIVHPGHIRYLQFARRLGDILIVSLTGDAAVDKGPGRPYIPQELRAENIAALEFVDWVVIDPHPTACELLEALRPDVYVKGREYATLSDPRFARERQIVESHGGRVLFHSGDVVFSSTRLMRDLGRADQLDEVRLRTLCSRNGIDLATTHATLESFPELPVVVVGDIIRERYIYCDAVETAADAPLLALRRLDAAGYWGGAAAVALQLVRLGAKPVLLAAAGRDRASKAAARCLTEAGVDVRFSFTRTRLPRRCTFLADDAKLARVSFAASCPLDSAAERSAAETLARDLAAARLLIWADYGLGMVTPGLLTAATPHRRSALVTVAYAPGPRSDLRPLQRADLIVGSERNIRESVHDMASGLPAVVWELLNRTSAAAALVSLRRRGLIGFNAGRADDSTARREERLRSEFVPSFPAPSADLLGVEESVLAVAALTLAAGRSLPMATYLASAAEALGASQPGVTPVALDELLHWCARRPELRPESRFFPDVATLGDIALLAPPLAMQERTCPALTPAT
jgi:rfaE bifunctional protein nucleotidyltransferase chain/domain